MTPPARSLETTRAPADWSLEPAAADGFDILDRLLQLYLYDFSEIAPADLATDGRFPYPWLDRYRIDPSRHAFVLRVRDRPAGFALVRSAGNPDLPDPARHQLAEFFVMRALRRSGVGTAMAHDLFDRFSGGWWIEQIAPNVAAQAFWRRVIAAYTGGRFTEHVTPDGAVVQRFDTADKADP